ncbi:ABC transporter permease [Vallitalea guaymasensis]|uniref:ABC transporter permease n=1 Tax=Vallitalea guaymasensis TaxID=1185412 RepID=UPI002357983F|nr:iron ABC transporter permease [Vallitalea guaymasensis]
MTNNISKRTTRNWSRYRIIKTVLTVVVFIGIAWFIIALMYIPVMNVFKEAFFTNGRFDFNTIKKLFASKTVRNTLQNTFVVGILTIVTVNIVGIFQIAVTEYFSIKFSKFIRLIYFVPLILGGISLVTGLKYIYSAYGMVTRLLTVIIPSLDPNWFTGFFAVMFVHTFFMTNYHILFVRTSFKKVDYLTIEAAKSLGAGNFKTFIKVVLPVIKPSIFSATVLVFLTAIVSNAAPTELGGKDFHMINSIIQTFNSIGRQDFAALLALILGLASIIMLLIFRKIENKGTYISVSKVPTKIKKISLKSPVSNFIMHFLAYALCIVYILPVIAIFIYSLADVKTILTQSIPTSLSFNNYITVFSERSAVQPLINSLIMGLVSTGIALVVGIFASVIIHKSKKKATLILELSLLIPWVVPTSMLAIGLLVSYDDKSLLMFNKPLIGGWWLLPLAYTVFSIPTIVRMTRAALFGVNTSLEESARSLGASPSRTFFSIVLPLIIPTVVSVAAISVNGKLSEYTASVLLYSASNKPLSIALRQAGKNTNPQVYANNLVYVVLLMIVAGVILGISSKYREKN